MPLKVFISYSSADRAEALAVRRLLSNRGCTVWLDVFDIRVAADLKSELGGGIAAADVLCLLLSPTAVESPWVVEEVARGEEQEAARGMRLVAVLLRPCRPPDRLLGRVMLDATAGITSPDVGARLARAVLGAEVVGDLEIDAAMQAALQARMHEMEAALVLPELATKLDAVRETPIRKLEISFRHEALPRGKVLAIRFTFDQLFSQPMWFYFAHYREGHTWPQWMKTMGERDYREVRSDGKRVDGRFKWFEHVRVLSPNLDGTPLRDLPATFGIELSGETWRPGGFIPLYPGGPGLPHLPQRMEVPSLAALIKKKATFDVLLFGDEEEAGKHVPLEENDLHVRLVGTAGEVAVTLFRSAHAPIERAVLRGAFLQNRPSPIEREAILALYPRPHELAAAERQSRDEAAAALLNKPEESLSPDERRVVGRLFYDRAQLLMFRVYHASPPLGSEARTQLHLSALRACSTVCRVLGPLVVEDPRFDDVGMAFWAASNLAAYFSGHKPERAVTNAQLAAKFVWEASRRDPDEPEYQRWYSDALRRLAEAEAATGRHTAALKSLDTSIEVLRALYEQLPTPGRRDDVRKAIESALRDVAHWPVATSAARARWASLASTASGNVGTERPIQ